MVRNKPESCSVAIELPLMAMHNQITVSQQSLNSSHSFHCCLLVAWSASTSVKISKSVSCGSEAMDTLQMTFVICLESHCKAFNAGRAILISMAVLSLPKILFRDVPALLMQINDMTYLACWMSLQHSFWMKSRTGLLYHTTLWFLWTLMGNGDHMEVVGL